MPGPNAPLWEDMTPDERIFLHTFAQHYRAGRRLMCWSAHALVALGILAGALVAIAQFLQIVSGLRPH